MEEKKKSSRVKLVFGIVFFSLASLAAVGYATVFVELLIAMAEKAASGGNGEIGTELGLGLSVAILFVFQIIAGLVLLVLSAVSTVLSALLVKGSAGGERVYSLISLCSSAAYILAGVGTFLFTEISLN